MYEKRISQYIFHLKTSVKTPLEVAPAKEGLSPKRLGLLIFFFALFVFVIEITLEFSVKRHAANNILTSEHVALVSPVNCDKSCILFDVALN